jgi:23S rRNA pseudouridine1911/1915/1917 synthase
MQVLLEDNHCLAVVKPAGLPTQAPAGYPSLEAEAKAYLKEKYHKPGNVYLGVPHRLDRPVSGVVLFARNSKAAERLAEQFRERTVTKTYWGIVAGSLEPGDGEWIDWLAKVVDEARAEITTANAPGSKEAVLRYRVRQTLADATFVEFTPVTGRMHQIRIQAASRGHPILGDALYGSTRPFGPEAASPRERIIALHARNLAFQHPLRYEPVSLTAPLPEQWSDSGIVLE